MLIMRRTWTRMVASLRASVTDRPVVQVDEVRGTVRVCDTSCRAAAARDRAVRAYLAGP
jgi:hypothetical protein